MRRRDTPRCAPPPVAILSELVGSMLDVIVGSIDSLLCNPPCIPLEGSVDIPVTSIFGPEGRPVRLSQPPFPSEWLAAFPEVGMSSD